MSIRDRLKRLERQSGVLVHIPQPDGPPARFPQSALADSFLTNMQKLRGEDVPPHPLGVAAARSPSPDWSGSFYSAAWVEVVSTPEDLSEPGGQSGD